MAHELVVACVILIALLPEAFAMRTDEGIYLDVDVQLQCQGTATAHRTRVRFLWKRPLLRIM